MTFNEKELTAIVNLAMTMAAADGRIANEENAAIALELVKFNVPLSEGNNMITLASQMQSSEAVAIVSMMNSDQKKYVTAYLAVIMAADGEIADSEVKLWSLITMLCGLPEMSLGEALSFWSNN